MDLSNLGTVDPFADLDAAADEAAEKKKKKKKPKDEDADLGGGKGDLIHIRVQQRNGRKCITTIQGLDAALDLKKILKAIKKDQCCNGSKLRPFFWQPCVCSLPRAKKVDEGSSAPHAADGAAPNRLRGHADSLTECHPLTWPWPAPSRLQPSWKMKRWARCSSSRAISATPWASFSSTTVLRLPTTPQTLWPGCVDVWVGGCVLRPMSVGADCWRRARGCAEIVDAAKVKKHGAG